MARVALAWLLCAMMVRTSDAFTRGAVTQAYVIADDSDELYDDDHLDDLDDVVKNRFNNLHDYSSEEVALVYKVGVPNINNLGGFLAGSNVYSTATGRLPDAPNHNQQPGFGGQSALGSGFGGPPAGGSGFGGPPAGGSGFGGPPAGGSGFSGAPAGGQLPSSGFDGQTSGFGGGQSSAGFGGQTSGGFGDQPGFGFDQSGPNSNSGFGAAGSGSGSAGFSPPKSKFAKKLGQE
ncbi:ATP-dependent RNA helicase glh-1 [Hyalella azteca]|uniref:ATP-dependent RNA helicase glh-1 n=1 Tax=Hyalella azteca TaxID=294128 RepID=A0A8B7NW00_HYAAZ|nr:ATP-dependent RNA helicase glh-1 [Hyalella azteca]